MGTSKKQGFFLFFLREASTRRICVICCVARRCRFSVFGKLFCCSKLVSPEKTGVSFRIRHRVSVTFRYCVPFFRDLHNFTTYSVFYV